MTMEKLRNLRKMTTVISFFFSVRFNSVFVSFSLLLNKYLEKENFFCLFLGECVICQGDQSLLEGVSSLMLELQATVNSPV